MDVTVMMPPGMVQQVAGRFSVGEHPRLQDRPGGIQPGDMAMVEGRGAGGQQEKPRDHKRG